MILSLFSLKKQMAKQKYFAPIKMVPGKDPLILAGSLVALTDSIPIRLQETGNY
jgi:hypothetical protein